MLNKLILCTLLAVFTAAYSFAAESNTIEKLRDKTFEEEISKGISVVDFYANWCAPCKKYTPIFEKVAKNWKDENVKFFKANVDECGKAAHKNKVYSIPATVIFYNGEVIGRFVGSMDEDYLISFIDNAIEKTKN